MPEETNPRLRDLLDQCAECDRDAEDVVEGRPLCASHASTALLEFERALLRADIASGNAEAAELQRGLIARLTGRWGCRHGHTWDIPNGISPGLGALCKCGEQEWDGP